jgi:UDP-N-acetylmuramoyl-L-alanyl-D-glutamate--2,6-diaminopimelate ligase
MTPATPPETPVSQAARSAPWAIRSLGGLARHLAGEGVEVEIRGTEDPDAVVLQGAAQDSRKVAPVNHYLAWKGSALDGHDFVAAAAGAGATASLVERFVDGVPLPQLRAAPGRRAAALAAMYLAGHPERKLQVTAVTGTNGKTTVAFILRHLLAALLPGRRVAALGTLGVVGPDGQVREGTGGLTTPGPVELALRCHELVEEGVHDLVLEASSHALEQGRLDALSMQVVAFTNQTRDHLDYHPTLDAYLAAKAHLLTLLRPDGHIVLNLMDPAWSRLPPLDTGFWPVAIQGAVTPGAPPAPWRMPALVAEALEPGPRGTRFQLRHGHEPAHAVELPLVGRFNVENALVAAGMAVALGNSVDAVARALSAASAPPGRMEVTVQEPVPVILDYAHTPDALARALETLRPLVAGRLLVVFGAGGDRDRTKRPEMGRVAAEGADLAIVTSDNPRTEDPERIVEEVVAGIPGADPSASGGEGWIRITDRRAAMAHALEVAAPGDAILLAGKGHETYQVVGTEVRDFDERVVIRELLAARATAAGEAS